MAGHHKWSELVAKMPAERRERMQRRVEAELAAMELAELRASRGLTQEELAQRLSTRQANVSQMERRTDMHISTLKQVIEAMGGELVITARFPDADVRLDQFDRVA
jgi:transcriptional regulator with XRE-family HTH domain